MSGRGTGAATPARKRGVRRTSFPAHRHVVVAALRAGRRAFPVHGLVEVDVTEAVERLESVDEPPSFTAFITAATARGAAQHPDVHAYRDWRGRLVTPDHVDVATMVEVPDGGGTFAIAHVLRDADVRTVSDLSRELRGVKRDERTSAMGRVLRSGASSLARLPGLMRAFYFVLARSPRLRDRSGTVAVTAVGMFGRTGGFGIAQPTIMTLSVLVGGRSMRPRVIGDEIVPRLVLDVTVSVDHVLVDGAPIARFVATLTDLIEQPEWLDQG